MKLDLHSDSVIWIVEVKLKIKLVWTPTDVFFGNDDNIVQIRDGFNRYISSWYILQREILVFKVGNYYEIRFILRLYSFTNARVKNTLGAKK